METDPEPLRLLITQPFSPPTALPRFFSTPRRPFLSWPTATEKSLCRTPPPTRVDDGCPPFHMNASINLTEVITHLSPGAMSRPPSLFSTSGYCSLIILGRAYKHREPYFELIASGRWGHQFQRVLRQMAHQRQVQSTNCKVLIGLWGGVDLEKDVKPPEWQKLFNLRLVACRGFTFLHIYHNWNIYGSLWTLIIKPLWEPTNVWHPPIF